VTRVPVEQQGERRGQREPVADHDHARTGAATSRSAVATRRAAAPNGSPSGGTKSGSLCTASQKPRARSSAGVSPSHPPKSYSASRTSVLTGRSAKAASRSCAVSTARPSGLA
jgi:hypothetical protein